MYEYHEKWAWRVKYIYCMTPAQPFPLDPKDIPFLRASERRLGSYWSTRRPRLRIAIAYHGSTLFAFDDLCLLDNRPLAKHFADLPYRFPPGQKPSGSQSH